MSQLSYLIRIAFPHSSGQKPAQVLEPGTIQVYGSETLHDTKRFSKPLHYHTDGEADGACMSKRRVHHSCAKDTTMAKALGGVF